jgi:type VI secretion system secreted protein Hcp
MAFTAYLFVEAEKGVIEGFTGEKDKTRDGKSLEYLSRVQSFHHGVRIPTQPQTGEPSGPGQHTPLQITVELDKSVAELYQALTLNQRIKQAKVYFFRSGAGQRAGGSPDELFNNWFTVTIENAWVVGMELRKAMAMGGDNTPDLLDLTFTYSRIRWQDHDDDKEAEYEWAKKAGGVA